MQAVQLVDEGLERKKLGMDLHGHKYNNGIGTVYDQKLESGREFGLRISNSKRETTIHYSNTK